MRFERVSLSNFKCYEDASVSLDPGVTVIHGINGSGKSSLLEACFFALYGATALDRTLDEIVTIGAEEAEIDLGFTHEGDSYDLYRRIRATGERATTADCVLEGPRETIEGVGDVEDRIVSMLRMDAEAFVNSAFVRQGEINKLINATPAERQRMIDRLLQLGTLETYRERAAEARLGVENLLDHWEGRLESLDEQIAEKEAKELHERRAAIETEIAELEETIDRYETNREEAQETRSAAESILETYEERQAELETVEERIAELRESIASDETRRSDLAEEITDHREAITELEDRIDTLASAAEVDSTDPESIDEALRALRERKESLHEEIMELRERVQSHESEAERARERAQEFEDQIQSKRERIEELQDEIEAVEESIDTLEEDAAALDDEIQEYREAFDEAPVAFGEAAAHRDSLEDSLSSIREEETALREDLATARSRVEEAESLLAEGKCPECGQPVEGSPHVESIEEYRAEVEEIEGELAEVSDTKETTEAELERAGELLEIERQVDSLESELENVGERLAEKQEKRTSKRERIEELQAEIQELEESATAAGERAETAAEQAESVRIEIGERNADRSDIGERIERLEELRETVSERAEHRDAIERLQETRETLADQNEERREHLEAARERKRALAEDFDEDQVAAAREDKRKAEEYLEEVESILAEQRAERDERRSDLGGVRNEIEELESLRSERESIADRVANLESLHEETEELESMYGDLRAELRQQNVARLERLLNETFELVYQNDSYARIELSGQYELTVYQKDGEPLEPDQLSGGERALFNLSLRTAIYRLLAEGIDGAAPMPPLILDEPTVFLDSGHVSQLVTLVESMRDLGVEQIIVVSHDDELIGAADDVIRVAKDATTNRSYIEQAPPSIDAV